ncbi:YqgE/AlgH family protein [Luteolibacter marinus]|uniref:YqgE/AlgH family protein n=1 Tax=Luteolibacter marinus TaxID=2776705 RepID=UPI0018667AAA|nr:YqgE/AlgH family protein [Luteolibacter marinus]
MSDPETDTPIDLQGKILLADPSLHDGIFDRSVILLADHSAEEGAFGLILNHPTGHVVGEFLKDDAFEPLKNIAVHLGGPVSKEHLTFSAFWWTQEDHLKWHVRIPVEQAVKRSRQPGTLVRAFVGYSGWTAGQLEGEIRRNSWITTRPTAALLGQSHDKDLWAEILRSMSPYHRILAEAPENPRAN